jgi:hypothetical protein
MMTLAAFWDDYGIPYLGYDQHWLEYNLHCGEILHKQTE